MRATDGWVLLAECHDVAELHALRAALEARGVPCQVRGEHTQGIMGAFHGSTVNSRVLVPAPALAVARELARDIVGPFAEAPAEAEAEADESPFRRAGEAAPEAEEAREVEEAPPLRLKSYARLVMIVGLLVGPLFGLGHVYAGRNFAAGLLVLLTLFAAPAALGGAAWAQGVLAGVWLTDVIGGAIGIAAYNRRLGRAARELGGAARPLGPAGP
ncbi:MAG: DUF2007 domain-containing protein [Myxococcales bacterium]|nr:DUF2007 domain-containing protein [Myxococcales bacterium]